MYLKNKKNTIGIFIHALFRTGSTYIWKKFREQENNHCYYEPLHHYLLNIDYNYEKDFNKFDLDNESNNNAKHYLDEYKNLLRSDFKGLLYFKKKFIFDEYCQNKPNAEFKKYIDYLLKSTENKQPVLQFNRTALRTRWFKLNYPDSIQVYLVRNPRDQWESYLSKLRMDKNVFIVMDLMISSLNTTSSKFSALTKYIPLIEYHNDSFEYELLFYNAIKDIYSLEEKYFIFYFIWLTALVDNVLNGNIILNINRLSDDNSYREDIETKLKEYFEQDLDFSDSKMKIYKDKSLSIKEMEETEKAVQYIIFSSHKKKSIDNFFKSIDLKDQNYLNLNTNIFSKPLNILKNGIYGQCLNRENSKLVISTLLNKFRDILSETQMLLYPYQHKLRAANEEICRLRKLLNQKDKHLEKIYKSYTYKVGFFLLSPIKMIKKFLRQ